MEGQDPGIYLPDVFFTVNYTGPGHGNFSYVVTYNTTDGKVRVQHSPLLVSPPYPFTYALFEQWPTNSALSARIQVFVGAPSGGYRLVYDRTIYLTRSGDGGCPAGPGNMATDLTPTCGSVTYEL